MTDHRGDSSSALQSRHELELAALVEGFEEARRKDPSSVTVESWCQQHPEFKDELSELLPGLLLMESVASETSEAADRRTELEPMPESIGEYRIKARIGRGGMGIVYLAEQASLGREVALKVLPTNVDLDRGFLERFQREAKAAARLLHPNIVPVFGAGQADGRHFFAMRYIEGASLDDRLRDLRSSSDAAGSDGQGFPQREAAKIVLEVASAVAHAHSKGILHRDIKPGNVLLDGDGRAWVTDFGLCRIDDAGQLTSDGAILGTLRYMAPEQIEGVADERSDVYGVGLLLFELLTMRPAFDSVKRAKVVHDVLHTPVPRLRRLRSDIPRSLETIVQKATAKLPQERYPSAEALQRDLEAYLEDRPISARPPSALYLARLFASRHRLATAVAVIASLLLGLLGTLYVRDLRASRELSERRAYVGDLAAAEAALREGATQRARFHLDQAPASLRAWEWAHLNARIDQSLGAVQLSNSTLNDLAVDPSGSRVAVASVDGVSVVNLPSLEAFVQIRCGRTRVVAWDSTGRHLFAGLLDGSLHHYGPSDEPGGGEFELLASMQIPQEQRREPKSMAVHGDHVIVGVRRGPVLRWRPRDNSLTLVDVLGGHMVSVGSQAESDPDLSPFDAGSTGGAVPAWSPEDEPLYWAASGAGEVAIYRGVERLRMFRVDNRQAEVTEVHLDPSLESGVFTTRVGSVLGFDHAGEEVFELYRASKEARALAVDGRLVAAVGTDKLVHIGDRERRTELRALSGSPHPLNAAAFAPGSRMILTASEDGWLRAFDRNVSGGGLQLHGHINDVNSVRFSQDGRRLITGGRDGVVVVWDVQRAVPLEVFTEPDSTVAVVGFLNHGGVETIYAGGVNGNVYCWTETKSEESGSPAVSSGSMSGPRTLKVLRVRPWINDADHDERTGLVFFATSNGITCMDPATLELTSPLESGAMVGDGSYFSSVTVHGGRAYAMSRTGELLVFDPITGETLMTRATGFPTLGSRLSMTGGLEGDGQRVARGVFVSSKRDVVAFDAMTGDTDVLFSSRTADGFLGELVMEALWIEDGERILATTRNGLVSVWDPKSKEHLLDLRGHKHWAMRIERCKATGWIASLSSYGGVRLWNTISSNDWAELAAEGPLLVDEASAQAAAASIERRGLMERVAAAFTEHDKWTSWPDRMLANSWHRANAADIDMAAVYALGSADLYRNTETVALLESASTRLPPGHVLQPLMDRALARSWDVMAWRDARRGRSLVELSSEGVLPARKTVFGVGALCVPFVAIGTLGALAPFAGEILWLSRAANAR